MRKPREVKLPNTVAIMSDRKKWRWRLGGVNVLHADLSVEMTAFDILEQRLCDSANLYEKPPPLPEDPAASH